MPTNNPASESSIELNTSDLLSIFLRLCETNLASYSGVSNYPKGRYHEYIDSSLRDGANIALLRWLIVLEQICVKHETIRNIP
jgi:hypothetical protein